MRPAAPSSKVDEHFGRLQENAGDGRREVRKKSAQLPNMHAHVRSILMCKSLCARGFSNPLKMSAVAPTKPHGMKHTYFSSRGIHFLLKPTAWTHKNQKNANVRNWKPESHSPNTPAALPPPSGVRAFSFTVASARTASVRSFGRTPPALGAEGGTRLAATSLPPANEGLCTQVYLVFAMVQCSKSFSAPCTLPPTNMGLCKKAFPCTNQC